MTIFRIRDEAETNALQRDSWVGEPRAEGGTRRRIAQPGKGGIAAAFLYLRRKGDHAEDGAAGEIAVQIVGRIDPLPARLVEKWQDNIGPAVEMRDVDSTARLAADAEHLAHRVKDGFRI